MSIGLNFGKEYLRMTEIKKTEIRIEKEQKKLQQIKNRIRLLNQRLRYLKKEGRNSQNVYRSKVKT